MKHKNQQIAFLNWKHQNAIKTDPLSPCVRNCCLDDNDICLGCFRNIEEIMQWNALNDEQKNRVMKKAAIRKMLTEKTKT